MRAEVRKINGHFMIPVLDSFNLDIDRFEIDLPEKIFNSDSNFYEKLNRDFKKEELLELITKGMPKNYHYIESEKSDKEIWYEEAKEKYE
jgi:lipoate-protein ligase A